MTVAASLPLKADTNYISESRLEKEMMLERERQEAQQKLDEIKYEKNCFKKFSTHFNHVDYVGLDTDVICD
jgi:hypothetical protein